MVPHRPSSSATKSVASKNLSVVLPFSVFVLLMCATTHCTADAEFSRSTYMHSKTTAVIGDSLDNRTSSSPIIMMSISISSGAGGGVLVDERTSVILRAIGPGNDYSRRRRGSIQLNDVRAETAAPHAASTSGGDADDRPVVIQGTVVSNRKSFAYLARLDVFFLTLSFGKCGGSLIASQWVLTAAHCLKTLGPLIPALFVKVTLGDLQRWVPETGEFKTVGFPKTHPSYYYDKATTIRNDIALVRLVFGAPTTDNIKPIALPPDTWSAAVEHTVDVAGWGYYQNSPALNALKVSSPSQELRKGNVSIADEADCVGLGYTYIADQMICMKSNANNQGTCQGDSGGPVVSYSPEDGTALLIGVISWGVSGCATTGRSVATEVRSYLSWIKQTTGLAST